LSTVRAKLLICTAALLLAGCVPAAWAVVSNGDGTLVATFDGGIKPSLLPRTTRVPVAVRVSGGFKPAPGSSQVPQLQRIKVGINREGQLFDRGLPVCRARQLKKATEADARRVCGDAIIGSGHVTVQAQLDNQAPFLVHATLLAFHSPPEHGHKQILAQAFSKKPPGSFVLTFNLVQHRGTFGTVLSTTVPKAAAKWAYLTHFDLTLQRTYTYRGQQRSYVSASCAAPAGFASSLYPFARVTYGFANGSELTMSQADRCRVVGSG
jgi:hypothetical protein